MLESYEPSEIIKEVKKEIAEENTHFNSLPEEIKDDIRIECHKKALENKNRQIEFFSGFCDITVLGDEYMNIYSSSSDQKFYLYQTWNSYGIWLTIDEMNQFLDSLPGSTKNEVWHGSEKEYKKLSKFQKAINYVTDNDITEEMLENLNDDIAKLYPNRSGFLY